MIIVAGHARFGQDQKPVHGTGSEIAPFLQKQGYRHILIRHSIFDGFSSWVNKFSDEESTNRFYGLKSLPFPLRVLQEQLVTFYTILCIDRMKLSEQVHNGFGFIYSISFS